MRRNRPGRGYVCPSNVSYSHIVCVTELWYLTLLEVTQPEEHFAASKASPLYGRRHLPSADELQWLIWKPEGGHDLGMATSVASDWEMKIKRSWVLSASELENETAWCTTR